ncbi:efflux transporter outer membrane subunit [Achromobacter spanius]|uniref:efflux transporter outer membrane subunit n=1 Tax=Achromobacter spanius TaxID=217203 RepID=UPI003A904463
MTRLTLLLAIALLLSACNFAPREPAPVVALPERFSDDDTAAGTSAQDVAWQQFFGDMQLRMLIGEALIHNRDLAAAAARIEQARAFYRIERANQVPHIDVGVSASRNQAPLSSLDPALAGSTRTIEFSQFGAQIGVSAFELDLWGRMRNLSAAALQHYFATVEGQRAFRLSLIANVAASYYDARAGEEGIALALRTVLVRRYALSVARDRLDAGVTSSVDFDQAAILLTQAEGQLAELRRTTAESWNRLWVLVGSRPDLTATPANPIANAGQFEALNPGLPSEVLLLRPDVRQAEAALAAADANIGVARAALFPRIALTASFGYASGELSGLFEGPNKVWTFGAGAALPLFDFGQRRAAVDLSLAQREERVALYEKTVQTAFSEVATGLVRRQQLREQLAVQEAAIQAQTRLAETAKLRYENGISIYLEVMDALRNLFSAELQLLMLRAAALQNGVSLYVALGGGLDDPVVTQAARSGQ